MEFKLLRTTLTLMKFSFYGICLQCLLVNLLWASETNAQQTKSVRDVYVDLQLHEATIVETFAAIEAKTDYTFNYSRVDLDGRLMINEDYRSVSVADILIDISEKARLKFKQINQNINVNKLTRKQPVSEIEVILEIEISGKVSTADGEALPGANILVKGTLIGTTTDVEGNYTLTVPDEEGATLVFSYIGYQTQEVILDGQTSIEVVMQEDVEALGEIVIIGYGMVNKSDLTGSVSSLRGEDLTKIPSLSAEQALQGKVSGVRVTSNSGEPGSAPTVRIRGVGTFGNPDPIFVVDGVILDDITFLNAADIASMEVLKDASSTAMYGSRGANGVIIITTKSGALNGKPTVYITAEHNLQTIQKDVDMLNAREFAEAVNRIQPGTFNNLDLLENTDWQQEVYRDYAPIQNYQLSVSGGGEKTKYYVGAGYFKQEGIIPKSDFERFTLKVNNQYNVSEAISIGHNLTFSKFDKINAANVVASTLRAWPTDPAFDDQGAFNGNRGNGNPLASIAFNNSSRDGIRSVGNFYGEVKFLKDFTFRSSFGLDLEYSDGQSFTPVFFVTPQQQNDETRLNKNRFSKENWLWENTLNYHLNLDDHTLDAVIGYTAQEDNQEGFQGEGRNLLRDNILYLSNDLTDIKIGNDARIKSLVSYLFRANYTFKDRYLFTATFRRDGSSIFSANNRWGNFPSFAAGWRISDEPFFNLDLISNLKLRASWGIVGNDKVAADERFTLIQNELGAVFGANEILFPGSSYGSAGNPKIRWEEARQTDIGLEVELLDTRLNVEVDYYRKETKDILIDLPLPGHFGNGSFAFQKFNAADVLNRGFEFNITWKDNIGELQYQIGAIGSTVHNEVLKLGEDTGADNFLPLGNLGNGQNVKRIAVGEPIGYFYGYKVAGVFQNEGELNQPRLPLQDVGDFRYVDVNGDGAITTDDRTFIGSSIPDFIYGFSASFSYEGFDLALDFQGESGKEIYDGKDAVRSGQYNYQGYVRNAWIGPGTSDSQPRVTAGGVNYSQSDWFIHDGSFLRLRSVTLGYSIPESLTGRLRMQNANVYLRGTNVFTITDYTGYTPEIGGDISRNGIDTGVYPVTSVYAVGLNLTF